AARPPRLLSPFPDDSLARRLPVRPLLPLRSITLFDGGDAMDTKRRILTILSALGLGVSAASAQIPDKFTNLQVLPKETSKADLMDVMKGFTAALGVRCTYCHVGEEKPGLNAFQGFKFDADDKVPKKVARAMMKMMADVN